MKNFNQFINESTTDGSLDSLIDVTRIAINMGVFNDKLFTSMKETMITGIKGSIKTERKKVQKENLTQFIKLTDSLLQPLQEATTINSFLNSLIQISEAKDNIIKRLKINEIINESKIINYFRKIKNKTKNWWQNNISEIKKKMETVLISFLSKLIQNVTQIIN